MRTTVNRLDLRDIPRPAIGWRDGEHVSTRPALVTIEGPYRAARCCIDAPRLDLGVVEGVTRYEVLVTPFAQPDTAWSVGSEEPGVDLSPIWHQLPHGLLQLTPRAWDGTGRLAAMGACSTLVRSPDWSGHSVRPFDYERGGRGVIDYMVNRVPPSPLQPDDLPHLWHANICVAGAPVFQNTQFPALCYPSFIDLFLPHMVQLYGSLGKRVVADRPGTHTPDGLLDGSRGAKRMSTHSVEHYRDS